MVDEATAGDIAPELRAGQLFGHYRLRRLLGRGGFGEVYEADDTTMDRAVALKLLAAPYSQNDVFRKRLFREARNAGKLHDPHVVPIHHCGEIDGQLYIDMRLIKGTDLQKVLARTAPLSPVRAVAIVRQVAAALDAAHSAGMVHRDIKPANILLADDDFACLVDFGLANAATDANLTTTGTTIGTFAYMAPERFSNTDVDHRADIYALACVLYECLTGAPPYPTGDLPALINAHLTAPIPRPCQYRPEIPAAFDDVIAVGLAKDPKNRFERASDLASVARHALRPAAQRQADTIAVSTQAAHEPTRQAAAPPPAPPAKTPAPRRPRRIALAVSLAALVVVGVVVAVAIILWPSPSPRPPARASRPSQSELPFVGLNSPEGVAVDSDGDVYVVDDVGTDSRVFELPAGSTTPITLPITGVKYPRALAVDASHNVYVADAYENARILKLAAGSTTPVVLPFRGLFQPHGLAVDSSGSVYVTDTTGPPGVTSRNVVMKLPAGSNTPVDVPFAGLTGPWGVAVDTTGNVYALDQSGATNQAVQKLPNGWRTSFTLPFTGLNGPDGIAVDGADNVYVADTWGYVNNPDAPRPNTRNRVLKLSTGSDAAVELPFTGLDRPSGIAVDNAGNVYVTDSVTEASSLKHGRVLKLSAG